MPDPKPKKRRPPTLQNGRMYPICLVPARYGGTYSGAKWHAWGTRPWTVPQAAYGSDTDCARFWGFTMEMGPDAAPDEDGDAHTLADVRGCFHVEREPCKADSWWVGLGRTKASATSDLNRQLQEAKEE